MNQENELTGGLVNYYLVQVASPQRVEQPPYQAECEDIIRALGMTFDEGCLFKALWRTAAARQGNGKPGQKELYDAEKMVHYGQAILKQATQTAKSWKHVSESKPEWYTCYGRPTIVKDSNFVDVQFSSGRIAFTILASLVEWNDVTIWKFSTRPNETNKQP